MSKKFFSLIFGDAVHAANKKKIIKGDEFSKLIDAQEILTRAKEDTKKYHLQIAQECEILKEKAEKEGFEEGFKKWADHVAQLEQEILRVRQELEKFLVPVALKAAKKIVGREIELSEETIVDIVSTSLKSVSQHKKIIIYANKKDLQILDQNRPRIKQIFESLESLSLREREDVTSGGCIIETEGGIINAQLDNQWRILEQALETILKKKESAHAEKH